MRNILFILSLSVLFLACDSKPQKKDQYYIEGTAKGFANGMRVYLKTKNQRGRPVVKQEVMVINEKFSFKGKADVPESAFIEANSVVGTLPLILENYDYTIALAKDSIHKSIFKGGSEASQVSVRYEIGEQDLITQRKALISQFRTVTDPESRRDLSKKNSEIASAIKDYPLNFLKENNNTYHALILLEKLLKNKNIDTQELKDIYNKLGSDLKSTPLGVKINTELNKEKPSKAVAVNSIAPNFSAPTPDGKLLSLNEVKGKVTVVEFWASWCKPCRRENPNLVNVYNKYHDKGLEIIGVSLDRPGQKDKWLKAIKDDNLNWHQVSNLMFWQDPIAKKYGVPSIPNNFILDSTGKVVATKLRGKAFENKIAELLK